MPLAWIYDLLQARGQVTAVELDVTPGEGQVTAGETEVAPARVQVAARDFEAPPGQAQGSAGDLGVTLGQGLVTARVSEVPRVKGSNRPRCRAISGSGTNNNR